MMYETSTKRNDNTYYTSIRQITVEMEWKHHVRLTECKDRKGEIINVAKLSSQTYANVMKLSDAG
jgi:hypothetical protein